MRRLIGGLLAGTLLLTACQVNGLAPGPTPSGKKAPSTKAEDTPRPDGTAGPAGTPTPGVGTPGPTGPTTTPFPGVTQAPVVSVTATPGTAPALSINLLHKPNGTVTLSGLVKLDGGYIVAAGAGNVLSHNGGSIVEAGAGNVLSHNGGLVLSHNGGSIVAAGAGNMVAAGAGNLVAAGAGNLVAAGAGNLVAAGAGNLVAAGAGNLVAAGAGNILPSGAGRKYGLTQATPTPTAAPGGEAKLAVGTTTPVAGAEIGVWSFDRRTFLPLGVDKDGKPVFTVFTNLNGGYEIYLPPSEAGNVMIVTMVDREDPDPRLTYGLVAEAKDGGASEIDEDTTVATAYVREAMASRLLLAFLDKVSVPEGENPELPPTEKTGVEALMFSFDAALRNTGLSGLALEAIKAPAKQFLDEIHAEAVRLGLNKVSPATRRAARRLADYALKTTPFEEIEQMKPVPGWYKGKVEKPIDVFRSMARQCHAGARAKWEADPLYFEKQSYWKPIMAARAAEGKPPLVIKRPSDLSTLVLDGIFPYSHDDSMLQTFVDTRPEAYYKKSETYFYKAMRTLLFTVDSAGVPLRSDTSPAVDLADPAAAITVGGKTVNRFKGGNDNIDRLNIAVQSVVIQLMPHFFEIQSDATKRKQLIDMLAEPTAAPAGPSPSPSATAVP